MCIRDSKSIYLDIYYKGVRKYEYLKLYLVPEINPVCKEQNKQTMAVAERIKAERIKALHGHGIQDWETVKPVSYTHLYASGYGQRKRADPGFDEAVQ